MDDGLSNNSLSTGYARVSIIRPFRLHLNTFFGLLAAEGVLAASD